MSEDDQVTTLRARLRARRLHLDYSTPGLAKRVGCAPNMIASIEAGRRDPSLKLLVRILKVLGMTIEVK